MFEKKVRSSLVITKFFSWTYSRTYVLVPEMDWKANGINTYWTRVPGLSIRDCTRDCSNCDHTCPQTSTTCVTKMILFERLYLVPGMGLFKPWVNCPYTLTTPTTNISRFLCDFFPRMAPDFLVITIHQVICLSTLNWSHFKFSNQNTPRTILSWFCSVSSANFSHNFIPRRPERDKYDRKTICERLRLISGPSNLV